MSKTPTDDGGKSEFYNFTEVESLAIEEVHKLVKVIVIIMANHDELISFVKIMKCFDRFSIYSYKAPAKTVLKFLYNGYGSLDDLITGNIKCEFVIFGQLASKRVLINQQVGAAFDNLLI